MSRLYVFSAQVTGVVTQYTTLPLSELFIQILVNSALSELFTESLVNSALVGLQYTEGRMKPEAGFIIS